MIGSRSRRGYLALVFLIVLPLLLIVLVMVLHTAHLEQARGEAQHAAQTAARAAALALVHDASLLEVPGAMLPVLGESVSQAGLLAEQNLITGSGTVLIALPDNSEESDVIFGLVATPADVPIRADLTDVSILPLINTVQVKLVRSTERANALRLLGGGFMNGRFNEMTRSATAILDRGVIGFRPVLNKPIPLAPLALISSPSASDSWENQVEMGIGRKDQFRYQKDPYVVLSGQDGLYEMTVNLFNQPRDESQLPSPTTNAAILQLGTSNLVEIAQQVSKGIPPASLAGFNGELVLGSGKTLTVPGAGYGPSPGSDECNSLAFALNELQTTGTLRAWPLYTYAGSGQVVLTGFVAARVMRVAVDPMSGLQFVLQPASMHSPAIVTEFDRRATLEVPPLRNRYLSRVRLAPPG